MQITRRLEFDAGHRIPNHSSQCRHLHGHRYVLEITLSGTLVRAPGKTDEGMVMDFAEVKKIAYEHIVSHWDHAFLVYAQDKAVVDFLLTLPDHKTFILESIPTVENLAQHAFNVLAPLYLSAYDNRLSLSNVRLYETPNCWADACQPSRCVDA